jgi:hypothetical protein
LHCGYARVGSNMRDAIKHIADCLGGDVNTMISTITTILIFGLGVIVNGIFKKLDKNRKRKIIRRNGLYTIKEINKLLIKQAKGYEYFSESLSYSKEPDFKLIQNANPFLEIWKML